MVTMWRLFMLCALALVVAKNSQAQEACSSVTLQDSNGIYVCGAENAATHGETNLRCPDKSCCSENGFCGPILATEGAYAGFHNEGGYWYTYDEMEPRYCNSNSQGDWRNSTCDSASSSAPDKPAQCEGHVVMDPVSKNPLCGPDHETTHGKLRCPSKSCCNQSGYCGPYIRSNGKHWEKNEWLGYSEAEPLYCNADSLSDYRDDDCDEYYPTAAPTPAVMHEPDCSAEVFYSTDPKSPVCGADNEQLLGKKLRCPNGTCCSEFGFCGPIKQSDGFHHEHDERVTIEDALPLYCNAHSKGDWQTAQCDDPITVFVEPTVSTPPHTKECDVAVEYITMDGLEMPICGPDNEEILGKKLRCPDKTCCSKWGYCGPVIRENGQHWEIDRFVSYADAVPWYCNDEAIGDYRHQRCDVHTVIPDAITESASPTCEGTPEYISGSDPADSRLYPVCGPDNEAAFGHKIRCPDDTCCSKFGYCGPYSRPNGQHWEINTYMSLEEAEPLYCNNDSTGDWRGQKCDPVQPHDSETAPAATPSPTSSATEHHCTFNVDGRNSSNCDGEYRFDDKWGNPLCGAENEEKYGVKLKCPTGSCCSREGICGPFLRDNGKHLEKGIWITAERAEPIYCNSHSSGDWRTSECDNKSCCNDADVSLSASDVFVKQINEWIKVNCDDNESSWGTVAWSNPTALLPSADWTPDSAEQFPPQWKPPSGRCAACVFARQAIAQLDKWSVIVNKCPDTEH